jgi:hypothetical protein
LKVAKINSGNVSGLFAQLQTLFLATKNSHEKHHGLLDVDACEILHHQTDGISTL